MIRLKERSKEIAIASSIFVAFLLGMISGMLLAKCPTKSKEELLKTETSPEKVEKIKEEKIRVYTEGSPIIEFFPHHITIYKPEVTTYQVSQTCSIPRFSPTVLEAPGKYTNRRMVDIVFSPGLLFLCKAEDFEFPCGVNSNRIKIEYLEDGPKTFEVIYKDEMGCEEAIIKISFIVDTKPPETKIIPVGFSDLITRSEATFRLETNEPTRAILCKIDEGFWIDCSGGIVTLSNLEEGWHKISAYSIDIAGNEEEKPKGYVFRVDARPPVSFLISAPPSITTSSEAIIEFDADEEEVRFECSLNEEGWSPCSSPYKVSNLKPGAYRFKLRSVDSLGRTESTPIVYSWTVVSNLGTDLDIVPFRPPRDLKKLRKYKKPPD